LTAANERLRARSDERRDRKLRQQGYTLLRLMEVLVHRDVAAAVELIAEQVVALRR
jgi:very-short-patch-repair endonuclease